MKKIFTILTIVLFGFIAYYDPVLACSGENDETITGAACSIKDLQEQQEHSRNTPEEFRPQKKHLMMMQSTMQNADSNNGCLFQNCLYRQLMKELEKKQIKNLTSVG